jgi:hypothetical protein
MSSPPRSPLPWPNAKPAPNAAPTGFLSTASSLCSVSPYGTRASRSLVFTVAGMAAMLRKNPKIIEKDRTPQSCPVFWATC